MADDLKVLVNGVNRNLTLSPGSLRFDNPIQDQGVLDCVLISPDEMYRPSLNHNITIVKDERTLTIAGVASSVNFTVSGGTVTSDDIGRVLELPNGNGVGEPFFSRILTITSTTTGTLEFAPPVSVTETGYIGKRIWAGYIAEYEEHPFFADSGRVFSVTAHSLNSYLNRILINTYFLAGSTIGAAFQLIGATIGGAFGTRTDPAMAAGPVLDELLFLPWRQGREVADMLSERSGWVWNITTDNTFRAYNPTDIVLPLLTTAYPKESSFIVSKSFDDFRNDQRVFYGGTGDEEFVDKLYGDGILTSWALHGAPITSPPAATLTVNRSGVDATETVGLVGGAGNWLYNPDDNTLTQNGGTVLAVGDYISFPYTSQFPLVVVAGNDTSIATYGIFGRSDELQEVRDWEEAQAHADALIERYSHAPATRIRFTTADERFTVVAAILPVNVPSRDLSSVNFLTDKVESEDEGDYTLQYNVEAVMGTVRRDRWIDFWRDMTPGHIVPQTPLPVIAAPCPALAYVLIDEDWTNTGASLFGVNQWEGYGYANSAAGNPIDPDYPGIIFQAGLQRNVGAGLSGATELGLRTGYTWTDVGVVWASGWALEAASVLGLGEGPNGLWNAEKASMTVIQEITAEALNTAYYHVVAYVSGEWGGSNELIVGFYGNGPGPADVNLNFEIEYQSWTLGAPVITFIVPRANIVGQTVRWSLCWECGTYNYVSPGPATVGLDGFLKFGYQIRYESEWGEFVQLAMVENIDLYINDGAVLNESGDGWDFSNRGSIVAVGWYGITGPVGAVNLTCLPMRWVMGPVPVLQETVGATGTAAGSRSASFAVTPAVGDLIVVFLTIQAAAFADITISDNQGNTYTAHDGQALLAPAVACWYAHANTSAGTFTVTATLASGTDAMSLSIHRVSGHNAANPIGTFPNATKSGAFSGTGQLATSNTMNDKVDNCLKLGAVTVASNVTLSPWTSGGTGSFTYQEVIELSDANSPGQSLSVLRPYSVGNIGIDFSGEIQVGRWRTPRWNCSGATNWKAVGIAVRPAMIAG